MKTSTFYNFCSKLIIFILIIFGFNEILFAAGGLRGRVFDKATNEPLIGANVIVQGTSLGSATDLEGRYSIVGIPAGKHTIVVSYIGYRQVTTEIEIIDNKTVQQDFYLEFITIEGETVVITAQVEGQVQAINQQLSSNTIANVVSGARIKELPDVNAAESIGRLPGVSIQRYGGEATKVAIRGLSPKYNTVTVNGIRVPATGSDDRSVDLSLISSNMLDGIELKKALTPDMDADAFGGSVDLKLKEAPKGWSANFMAQGGYNKMQSYYGNYNLNGSISNRFMDDNLGIILNFNADNYDRSADKFSADYQLSTDAKTGDQIILISNLGLREESVIRKRSGGSIVLDYRIPYGKVTANSFYNQLKSDALYRIDNTSIPDQRHYYDMERHNSTTSIFTGAISMEQDLSWIRYDLSIARSYTKTENPEDFRWRFAQEGNVLTQSINQNTHPSEIPDIINIDTASTRLQYIWVDKINRDENITSTQFNVEIPFNFSKNFTGYIKTGAKFKWLDRMNDITQNGRAGLEYGSGANNLSEPFEQLAEILPEWNLEELVGTEGYLPITFVKDNYTRDNFLNGEYDLGYTFSEAKMIELTRALQKTLELYGTDAAYRTNSIGSLGQDYDGIEHYQAAYIMAEINIGKYITLIPGVRWENEYTKYNGQRFREIISAWEDRPPTDFEELTNVRTNTFWLPMVHLKYKPYDWLQIRLARTETITRPDYIQYAPITSIDGFNSTVRANNALLKPARSINYDLSVAVYENYVGLFTISPFYKTIHDLIIPINYKLHPDVPLLPGTNVPASWYSGQSPTIYTYINNPYKATYKGIELEWQTNFWYLPSVFKGLVMNINYTYIESNTTYQGYVLTKGEKIKDRPPVYRMVLKDSLRTGRMPDQPQHILNFMIGYDYKDFSIRFSYLFQTDISTYIHPTISLLDTYSGEYGRFDISIRQKITKNFEAIANFNNINNRADRSFRGSAVNNPSYTEYYGFTMDVGLRYRL
ncbi:TonB-dependent receptor [Melioribacter sp. Ez-97]|uniref:TonB-dependent receptor n=1 Tax=Melioribacter sp. Ez-97 TaxID=3423434 RepID=UPI003ED99E2A